MANSLLVQLGFKTDKSSVSSAVSGVNEITSAIKGLKKAANLLVVGQGLREFSAGIKSIASSARNMVSRGFNFAEEFSNLGDSIAKTSRIVGLSVKDYQALGYAASLAGISTEELDVALKKFNVNLAKARAGDKASYKMFDSILGGRKLSRFKDSASLIAAIADGYTKLTSAEQKAFVSQELFGKSGLKMSELLSAGGSEISKMFADYDALGGGFSEEGVKRAEEFNDELFKMKLTIASLKMSVAQEMFPTFIDLFKSIRDFVKDNRASLIPVVSEIFGKTSELIKSLLPYVPKILNSVLSIVDKIGPKAIVIGATVISILPAVGHILFGLYQMASILKVVVVGFKGLLNCGWAVFNAVKLTAAVLGGPTLAAIGGVLILFVEIASIVHQFYKNWDMWCSFVNNELTDAVVEWWNQLKAVVSWAAEGVGGVFFGIGEAVRNFVMGGLDTIYGAVQKIKNFIGEIFGGLPGKIQSFFGLNEPLNSGNLGSSAQSTLGGSVAQSVRESHTTTTSRFSVDFKNMPKGVQVTPPDKGDFDWSRGYVLGGV